MTPYINIHTHRPEADTVSVQNVRLQSPMPDLPTEGLYTAGIHPWDASVAQADWLDIFMSDPPGLVAVGETGLDFRPEFQPFEVQKEWFEKQIEIANRLHKPLIIHQVHASNETMDILGRHAAVPVILHGFTGSPELIRQWLRRLPEVRFSFGPTVMRSPKTQAALQFIAAEKPERFFLETDDDPDTGIREMYKYTAGLWGWEIDRLKECISLNFNNLFSEITFL